MYCSVITRKIRVGQGSFHLINRVELIMLLKHSLYYENVQIIIFIFDNKYNKFRQ